MKIFKKIWPLDLSKRKVNSPGAECTEVTMWRERASFSYIHLRHRCLTFCTNDRRNYRKLIVITYECLNSRRTDTLLALCRALYLRNKCAKLTYLAPRATRSTTKKRIWPGTLCTFGFRLRALKGITFPVEVVLNFYRTRSHLDLSPPNSPGSMPLRTWV